ncbi:MAG: YigZ family protein [Oscillospiraceae bacterium]|nr:YigZ family protein [Oscillospiraceae bacterium]
MEYKTIRARAEDEFIERRSRFIGHIAPVGSEEEAIAFIEEVRASNREANHNCYAYVLREGQIKRYSDDGEPQGTAGTPILEVLLRNELVDVCAVVTRYFGGVLLGAGGLVRAYSTGASLAVAAGGILRMAPCTSFVTEVDYALYGKLSYLLPQYNIQVLESDFGEKVRLVLLIRSDRLPAFEKELQELSAGQVSPFVLEERYADME